MELSKRTPFKDLEAIYDRFFPTNNGFLSFDQNDWSPMVDIDEDEKEFTVKAELPEVKKEDIKVSINNHVLTLTGVRKFEKSDKKHHRTERFYGHFSRSFSLPDNVDEQSIKAEHKDGMLYLHLLKKPGEASKSINVDIS
ncbi:Hsp20/alpha crystallin family protein [Kangiella sediminilitoris]|uniref:Heat shock protein Hsp20 n=1 Tax=Kangiella sediminilitoris TaxID=1144748 RepID=A0A1B3BAP4_9GAMM|nr:Hsp20/alpha crystallin family protein [Kangiella sediminilitoris]AOE49857.1 Heat shock protein Hsp20 [Kangiella sediminilitoris]